MTRPVITQLSALISDKGIRQHVLDQYEQMTDPQKSDCVWCDQIGLPLKLDFPSHHIKTDEGVYFTNTIWVIQNRNGHIETIRGECTSGLVRKGNHCHWESQPQNLKDVPELAEVAIKIELGIHRSRLFSSGCRFSIFRKTADSRIAQRVIAA